MQNYIVPRLEVILDQEKALSHSSLVAMIEARLGADDKPPDMKVWSKGRGLADVRPWMWLPLHFLTDCTS